MTILMFRKPNLYITTWTNKLSNSIIRVIASHYNGCMWDYEVRASDYIIVYGYVQEIFFLYKFLLKQKQ